VCVCVRRVGGRGGFETALSAVIRCGRRSPGCAQCLSLHLKAVSVFRGQEKRETQRVPATRSVQRFKLRHEGLSGAARDPGNPRRRRRSVAAARAGP